MNGEASSVAEPLENIPEEVKTVNHENGSNESCENIINSKDISNGDNINEGHNDTQEEVITDPSSKTPSSEVAIPEVACQQNVSTQAASPENASPENVGSEIASPENASPEFASPENASPEFASPENAITEACSPENSSPEINNSEVANKPEELNTKDVSQCSKELSEQENTANGLELSHSSNDSYQDTGGDALFVPESVTQDKEEVNTDQADDGDSKVETFKIVTIEKHHSDDEVESIDSADYSGSDVEPKAEDAVSIVSDSDVELDEDSHNSSEHNKSNDVIILDNETNAKHNGKPKISSEVHVIGSDNENDDCLIATDDIENDNKTDETNKKQSPKKNKNKKPNNVNVELRRSSRAIKRKKYSDDVKPVDDESDIEEVVMEDPLKRKSKSLIISKVTASPKTVKPVNKDEGSVVILDSPVKSKTHTPLGNKLTNSNFNQNIYQTIASRGTSVTPVSSKSLGLPVSHGIPIAPPQQAPTILPTLTDDMFVVEAPSFIVPYVYEKPAKMPFKAFVVQMGKEIEEARIKEEKELLEKKKAEKEQRQKEKQEKRDRGEEVEDSEPEQTPVAPKVPDEVKKTKAEKKEKRRRKKDDDDVSWDGSSSEESDDTITDEESNTVVLKAKADDSIEEIKGIAEMTPDTTGKTNSYFDLFLGNFFMNIGANLVQEHVQTDLMKQQTRKLVREKKAGHSTKERALSIAFLTNNLELSRKNNEIFTFEQKKCKICGFKTESALALAHHMETPHMRNNLYRCNFCEFEVKAPQDILYHMECKHAVKGKLERALSLHQCANCPFEDHGKGKLARHLISCAKRFKPETNLAPPVDWEHPAKIAKMSKNRNSMTPFQVSQFGRNHVDNSFDKVSMPIAITSPSQAYRPRNRKVPRPNAIMPMPVRPSGLLIRQAPPAHSSTFPTTKKSVPPSISITPLPRQPTPVATMNANANANAKGFVICEICDGYIKDLEQLRNHMQWIHKVKIHPKMIYNRPPLNCQKCQFRFFTDQGLERHLLGSHGLVTSSMQEAANKGKDAGRCPVCGRVYQWKLLGHVSRDHNLTLKPAHLSYKCTVCTATFGMYRQFENHVYSAHSVVAKKVIDKKTKPNANDTAAKQLKINDEITITSQPVKAPAKK